MNKTKIFLIGFSVLLLFCPLANLSITQATENEVISQGIGNMTTLSEASARDAALEDALRRAVEQAVGTMISSDSMVENYTLIYDRIYSKSTGYIKKYRIIKEEARGGAYTVKIIAEVGINNIRNDLEAIGLLMSRKHKPRVMVVVGETIADKRLEIMAELSVTENAIINQFLSKGFKIVDADTVKKVSKRDQLLSALEGDNALAAKLALQYGAEVFIMGKATASSSGNVMGSSLKSVRANITARTIRADTAEIIANDSATGAMAHIDLNTGAHQVFKSAGSKLAERMIQQILDKWGGEIGGLTSVELTISGLDSFTNLLKLKTTIKQKVRGVKDIHQRSFTGGVAKLEIELKGDTQTLAEALVTQQIGSTSLDITDISQNKIQAKVME